MISRIICAVSCVVVIGLVCGCKVVVSPTITIPPTSESAATIERVASGEIEMSVSDDIGNSVLEKAIKQRRFRTAEIQEFKNNRIVGENYRGYLEILELPPGKYGDYVRRTVDEENKDRITIYGHQASQLNLHPEEIERSSAKVIYNRAFRGEWVQEFVDGNWVWVQKESGRTDSTAAK
ncbi:MAG: DUF1318 domain-containing protein [Reinekea sp.]|nr:DUF1318 domain-containing protein [Reinekea sp.]